MNRFVLDCSVAMKWFFHNEATSYTDRILQSLNENIAVVPPLFYLETANVILLAEKHKKATVKPKEFISLLCSLPIQIEPIEPQDALHRLLDLARDHLLTSYDASYLDLAIRLHLPIATLDSALIRAAAGKGVSIY